MGRLCSKKYQRHSSTSRFYKFNITFLTHIIKPCSSSYSHSPFIQISKKLKQRFGLIVAAIILLFVSISYAADECQVGINDNFDHANISLGVNDQSGFQAAGNTTEGQLLKINFSKGRIYQATNKYKVIYRADPRFNQPVIFVAKYDSVSGNYKSDWQDINSSNNFTALKNSTLTYVSTYPNRSTINVNQGDAIDIKLLNLDEFFQDISFGEISSSNQINIASLYTSTGGIDNRMLYISSDIICTFQDVCTIAYNQNYGIQDFSFLKSLYVGIYPFTAENISDCSDSNIAFQTSLCAYNSGIGMEIGIDGGNSVHKQEDLFFPSNYLTTFVIAKQTGTISFNLPFKSFNSQLFNNIYNNSFSSQLMPNGIWQTAQNAAGIENQLVDYSVIKGPLVLGRYLMEIEVVNSANVHNAIEKINYSYKIVGKNGETFEKTIDSEALLNELAKGINAPISGNLFVKVDNPNSSTTLSGEVQFQIQTFNGSQIIGKFINDQLIQKLKNILKGTEDKKTTGLSQKIFGTLVAQGSFGTFVYASLTLYIVLYGIFFLMGAVQMTAHDLTIRIIKICLVAALFSTESWTFFNETLFDGFFNAAEKLITLAASATADVNNPFGFIDPMIQKYTTSELWKLIWVYCKSWEVGYVFIAGCMIVSIFYILKGIVEIVTTFLMSLVGLSIVIALAPFFITAILFERTRSIFDNWFGLMFGYVVQPTISIILLLFADQIIGQLIADLVVPLSNQDLFSVGFHTSLGNLSIDFNNIFTVSSCLPDTNTSEFKNNTVFSACLMFLIIAKLVANLVDFSQSITDLLTMHEGTGGGSGGASLSMGRSIMGDATSVAMAPINKVKNDYVRPMIVDPFKQKIGKMIDNRITKVKERDALKQEEKKLAKENKGKVDKFQKPERNRFDKKEIQVQEKTSTESSISDVRNMDESNNSRMIKEYHKGPLPISPTKPKAKPLPPLPDEKSEFAAAKDKIKTKSRKIIEEKIVASLNKVKNEYVKPKVLDPIKQGVDNITNKVKNTKGSPKEDELQKPINSLGNNNSISSSAENKSMQANENNSDRSKISIGKHREGEHEKQFQRAGPSPSKKDVKSSIKIGVHKDKPPVK